MDIPALHGNWVDLGIIIVVLAYLLGGWGRGLILGMIDLLGFLISFAAALKFYPLVGKILIDNFSLTKGIAHASGFLMTGILVEMLFSFLVLILYRQFYKNLTAQTKDKKILSRFFKLDRFLGFIPATGEALIFTAFILTLFMVLPIQGKIKKDIIDSKIGGPLVGRTQSIERQLNSIFGEAVNETLTFLTINASPISEDRVSLGFKATEMKVDEGAEMTMLNLINEERVKAGLRHLSLSFQLQEIGRIHAKDMFSRGYFSHYNPEGQSPFDRMNKAGIEYAAAGENLALAPNVYLAHQGLINSPGHRANILSPDFSKIGIGTVDGGIYGEMFVQEFTN